MPLNHPGRDRERGRIWRIVYKGTPEKPLADKLPPDLTKKSLDELIALTGEANLTLRMLAMWQIVDRFGGQAVSSLKKILPRSAKEEAATDDAITNREVCALWALFNLKKLDHAELSMLAEDPYRTVRVHAMRALAETEIWDDLLFASARKALNDADPWVRRGAADALGRHPAVENVKALIALRQDADATDTHLIHVARMALRNQFLMKGIYEKLAALNLSEAELQAVADVCLGAPSEDAAAVLVKYLSAAKEPPKDAAKYLEHAMEEVSAVWGARCAGRDGSRANGRGLGPAVGFAESDSGWGVASRRGVDAGRACVGGGDDWASA